MCGVCGGSLCARSRGLSGGRRHHLYGCTTYERKGAAVCGNAFMLPLIATDQALLEALEAELLNPAVIARTIEKAVAALTGTGPEARLETLQRDLATTEAQLGRVTPAIVLGGALESLVAELKRLEVRRVALVSELEAVEQHSQQRVAAAELVAIVEATVADYRGLLTRQTSEARAILRELLVDRVVYTPVDDRVEFAAQCSVGGLLRGTLATRWCDPGGFRRAVVVFDPDGGCGVR